MRGLILLLALAVSGCMNRPPDIDALTLPPPQSLDCCWQATERLVIATTESQLDLLAVLAVQNDNVTLVLMDTLGSRLLSVTQGNHGLVVDSGRSEAAQLPVRLLLLGVYLRHLESEDWRHVDRRYRVEASSGDRTLMFNDQEVVEIKVIPDTPETVQLSYFGIEATVTIETVEKIQL